MYSYALGTPHKVQVQHEKTLYIRTCVQQGVLNTKLTHIGSTGPIKFYTYVYMRTYSPWKDTNGMQVPYLALP